MDHVTAYSGGNDGARNGMKTRMVIMLVAVAVVFGGVFGFITFGHYMRDQFMHSLADRPQTVSTMIAGSQEWQPTLEAIGSVRAASGADLSAAVAGLVSAIHFQSGEDVKAGTLLLQLAQADDVAKLESLRATAALARITFDRDSQQYKIHAVSRQTVDTDTENLKNDMAQVAQQEATVGYKNVRAPFSGRLGIRQVDLGQYLAPGTAIVTLQSLDPIYVDFYLPQEAVAQLRVGLPLTAAVDAYPGKSFSGMIAAINPKVDTSTRNVELRASFGNPGHLLLPGMYAKLNIAVGERHRYVTLPATSISFSTYGATVFLVDHAGSTETGQPRLAARQVVVETGMTRGDQVAVLRGVRDGDSVVTAGQIKLRNGMPVAIDNSIGPKFDAAPQPQSNQ